MKALVCNEFGSAESLVIEDRETPAPGKGELLIDIKVRG